MSSPRVHQTFVAILSVSAVIGGGCDRQKNEYQPPPPPKVTVAKPVQKSVTNYLVETGETEAVRQAEVRVRVTGFLEQINFEPGEDVEQGAVLYVIQQREFKAKLAAAKAEQVAREVDFERAEIEYQREKAMQAENATSERKVLLAQAMRDTAQAAVGVAAAQVELAQKDMDDTEVRALIDGRVGKTLVKEGNLVEGPAGTHLTNIIQYDPIYANFNISERQLLELRRQAEEKYGDVEANKGKAKLHLQRLNDDGFPFEGRFNYAGLDVDQSTGTFPVRGIFPNPDRAILPGLFVRIQIPLGTIENALLLPDQAIGSDQRGDYVLVVVEENKVERRNVTRGLRHEGMVVISNGITADERVIIEGMQRARPGSEVRPEDQVLEAPSDDLKVVTEGSSGPAEPSEDEGASEKEGVPKTTTPPEKANMETPAKS